MDDVDDVGGGTAIGTYWEPIAGEASWKESCLSEDGGDDVGEGWMCSGSSLFDCCCCYCCCGMARGDAGWRLGLHFADT